MMLRWSYSVNPPSNFPFFGINANFATQFIFELKVVAKFNYKIYFPFTLNGYMRLSCAMVMSVFLSIRLFLHLLICLQRTMSPRTSLLNERKDQTMHF